MANSPIIPDISRNGGVSPILQLPSPIITKRTRTSST